MTSSGDLRSGAAGEPEPDWIDQVLQRATSEVEPVASSPVAESSAVARPVEAVPTTAAASPPNPVTPAPTGRAASPANSVTPAPTGPATARPNTARPVAATAEPTRQPRADELADIQWVDAPEVSPASTPIVSEAVVAPRATTPVATALVPEAVGRSAWDDELQDLDGQDPEGWEQLSWQDLDGDGPPQGDDIREGTITGGLIREWGPVIFAAVAIALFTRLVLVQAYHIPSPSMVPALEIGDRVVVNRLSYNLGEIERGQVIVFAKPPLASGNNDLIKRVIGLPGEEVRFRDNQVYINGLRVEEPYLARPDSTRRGGPIPGCAQAEMAADLCVVPQGYVFMMGDNREHSNDSRVFGPVAIDTIVGRAFLKVWPLNDIGQL